MTLLDRRSFCWISSLAPYLVGPYNLWLISPPGQRPQGEDKQGERPGTELELVPLWKN